MSRYRESGSDDYRGSYYSTQKCTLYKKIAYGGIVEDQVTYTSGPFSLAYDDLQSISDVVGLRSSFNACQHDRHRVSVVSAPKSIDRSAVVLSYLNSLPDSYGTQWHCGKVEYTGGGYPFSPKVFFSNSFPAVSLPAVAWTDLTQSVGQRLDGSMQSKTYILVTLTELMKTVQMLKNPMQVKSLMGFVSKGTTLRSLTKTASNMWLERRYGWKPLINDIQLVAGCMEKVSKHMAYLRTTYNRFVPVKSRKTYTGTCADPTSSISPFPASQYSTASVVCVGTEATREAAFGVEIHRDYTFRIASQATYIKQLLGVNDLLESLWDAVPLSFVVDWFVDITKLVGRDPISWHRFNLRRMGYSTKDTTKVKFYTRTVLNSIPGVSPTLYAASGQQEEELSVSYSRNPGLPPGGSTGLFGSLRLVNLADAGAIIAQRLL